MTASVPTYARRRGVFLLLLLTVLLFGGASALAQSATQSYDPMTGGITYVLAFPDTTQNKYDSRQDTDPRFTKRTPHEDSIFIAIYSPTANSVKITGNGGYSKGVTMEAGAFEVVFLNGSPRAPTPIVTESGVVSNKTFRVEAGQPVIIYCFMVTKFGTEAWTPLPVNFWGTEHYAAALPGEVLYDEIPAGENNYGKQPIAGPSEILVIAAFDNTSVTIIPNGRLDKNPPTTVVLKKDQCYQVQSYVDTNSFNLGVPQPDLGGSYIYSSRPVGVISANTRSQALDKDGGLAKNSFKNMMVEWLTPVEQHGTEFVYLPTSDDRKPTGAPGERPDEKRRGEIVRVYATAGLLEDNTPTVTKGLAIEGLSGNTAKIFEIERTKFYEQLIGAPVPHVYKTDKPAQAYMNTTAVVRFNGTTGGGSFVGSSYESWATYMVQLVPREQWSWVAPYYAPIHPPQMSHFLNIVTDEKSRNKIKVGGEQMVINRQIAGTDLWWGTRTLNRGEQGVIQGADSTATFYAYVYGSMKGFETYRPGRTKKDGDGSGSAGNRDRRVGGADQALHPSEYEENIGFMYGYPVAARRAVLKSADSLNIVSTYDCDVLTVKITTLNANPAGLASVTLENGVNAKLVILEPAPPAPILGAAKATVQISPIDGTQSASGMLVIRDRTGKSWTVPYTAQGGGLQGSLSLTEFGEVAVGSTTTRQIVLRNPLTRPVVVTRAVLIHGNQSFRIEGTVPAAMPATIKPADSLVITISFTPNVRNGQYSDSVRIVVECGTVIVPLHGATPSAPCIQVDDLNFGTLRPGEFKVLPLTICNRGGGTVTFQEPWLTRFQDDFVISAEDMQKLKDAVLGPNGCVTINVLFSGVEPGGYRDVARLWMTTRDCRDTSVWTAIVDVNAGADGGSAALAGYSLNRIEPNPFSSTATIGFSLGRSGRTTVEIFDAAGTRVASLADGLLNSGGHRIAWSPEGLPSGVYYCRINSGAWSVAQPVLLVR